MDMDVDPYAGLINTNDLWFALCIWAALVFALCILVSLIRKHNNSNRV